MEEVKNQIALGEFPDELTFDQFDKLGWESKQFGLNDSRQNSEIAEDVLKYTKKTGGQIYTQVDWDALPDYRGYSKGMRFVNRTGIWEVITGVKLRVDNK